MSARALWITGPGRVELRPCALPTLLEPDQVRVQTLYSGVSRGTESLILGGCVPESEYARMRAPFQQGDFPFPVKYGYSNVGRVVAGAAFATGTEVFCLYPHQSEFVVDAVALTALPTGLSARRATLAANMETALNALWDARPVAGDQVTVVGAGTLGCLLTSLLCRSLALEVELVDVDPQRERLAVAFGCSFRHPEQASLQRDCVFHTSASQAGLNSSLALLRAEGRLFELSWYGTFRPQVALGGAFHSQRLHIHASQVGRVSPSKPGFTAQQRLNLALSLLLDPALDELFNPDLDFADLPNQYVPVCAPGRASAGSSPAFCVRY